MARIGAYAVPAPAILSYVCSTIVGMLETVHQLAEDVAKAAAAPLWSLTDTDLIACLQATHRLEQSATALKARLVRGAVTRALPATHGHRTAAGWLRTHLLLDPQPARDLADHATTLGAHPTLDKQSSTAPSTCAKPV